MDPVFNTLCGFFGEDSPREQVLPLDPQRETKRCEVFGYGRQTLGSYSIAPATAIRVCHERAERMEVMIGALTEPIDADEMPY